MRQEQAKRLFRSLLAYIHYLYFRYIDIESEVTSLLIKFDRNKEHISFSKKMVDESQIYSSYLKEQMPNPKDQWKSFEKVFDYAIRKCVDVNSEYQASELEKDLNELGLMTSYTGMKKFKEGVVYAYDQVEEYMKWKGLNSYNSIGNENVYGSSLVIVSSPDAKYYFIPLHKTNWKCVHHEDLAPF
ncbi:hypothetical protein [Mongoliitalea daihaiensis]|uniref:hypothetical protein n=1 Tax=Mongoliitalea daihaiensis TaxID=2782006 RepID=UPI001F22847E|nr:hypothetical protein [Mongoliitalea daihaiensis]UJP64033.1 hypothetical protein IPZ59_14560 [Mongoliitalea daihaiensis]